MKRPATWVLLGVASIPYAFVFGQPQEPKKVGFGSDIVPLLRAHCTSCHTGASAAAKLDLTDNKAIARMLVAGKPAESVLLQRIKGLGGKPAMPLGFPSLTAAEIAKFEGWIAQGAQFDNTTVKPHWAYVTPVRPPVPKLNSDWVKNPIDAFVLARMKKAGLKPSPTADRETLLRRVSLDLTGLPPTLAEMDAFLADRKPGAYERVVDRLLASKQFGVKQARHWLDLARYADSNGYEKDLERSAWKYRDWVVDAYNANLPYDQFTIRQIAGDLLPNATLADRVATGFHRNTMFNQEGGVDQEEAHFSVVLDRTDTTATVWLGSTLACARCHDHKYDPFSQRDYYRLAAFFSNSKIYPRGPKEVGEEKWFEASIPVPSEEQTKRQADLNAAIAKLDGELKQVEKTATEDGSAAKWVDARLQEPRETLKPISAQAEGGVNLTVREDGTVLASGASPNRTAYHLDLGKTDRELRGLIVEATPEPSLPRSGPGRAPNGNFVVDSVLVTADGKPVEILRTASDYIQAKFDVEGIGQKGKATGWAIDGAIGKRHELLLVPSAPIPAGAHVQITINQQSEYDLHTLGAFRLVAVGPDPLFAAVAERVQRNEISKTQAFLDYGPVTRDLRARQRQMQREIAQIRAEIPSALVMEENPGKRILTTWIRRRGEFLNRTEQVSAGTPTILPGLKKVTANRLDLARWLVRKDNPLTPRVEVNRMWENLFGRGLVETSEDFGTRGSLPTHPELLDWLATEFVARKWDIKAMLRLIVTSATYRQSSATNKKLLAKDPENLLLARGPRFRLEAEAIRDNALAAAGLLAPELGGPSVFPYQPAGTWNTPYSGEEWRSSMGKDRYRRSLYTFWKRTAPYPAFMAFDATSREACTVRRIRTNTPLQALSLMNDQQMIEASRALGDQMRKRGIATGFRLCTGRRATPTELRRLTALVSKLKGRYQGNPDAAAKLGGVDQAAWTMVGSVLLNLDETITKE